MMVIIPRVFFQTNAVRSIFAPLVKKLKLYNFFAKGPFKCYVTQVWVGGGINFSGEKCYEGVMFNVISVSNFQKKTLRNT